MLELSRALELFSRDRMGKEIEQNILANLWQKKKYIYFEQDKYFHFGEEAIYQQ